MIFKPYNQYFVILSEMEIGKDILEKIGKPSMAVPEGYFDSLKTRLESIPSREASRRPDWAKVRPYLALAASFAAILVIGNSVLRHTASKNQINLADSFESSYVEMISLTNPSTIYNVFESEVEEISDEDIINYLIESGATAEQLAYAGNNLR